MKGKISHENENFFVYVILEWVNVLSDKFWSSISIRKAKTSLIPVNNVGYSILSHFLNEKFE